MINRVIKGDLIKLAKEGEFDAIAHGCNCFNTMGAGIALQIKKEFPEAYNADQKTSSGDGFKLGTYSVSLSPIKKGKFKSIAVINAYTQYHYTGKCPVDYDAIERVFSSLNKDMTKGSTIGIPKIGAGLAGGNWNRISEIINRVTDNLNITLVEYSKE